MARAGGHGDAGIDDISGLVVEDDAKTVIEVEIETMTHGKQKAQKSRKSGLSHWRMATHSISMSQVGRHTGARVMT